MMVPRLITDVGLPTHHKGWTMPADRPIAPPAPHFDRPDPIEWPLESELSDIESDAEALAAHATALYGRTCRLSVLVEALLAERERMADEIQSLSAELAALRAAGHNL